MLAKIKFELCVAMNLIMYDNSSNLAKLLIIELGQQCLLFICILKITTNDIGHVKYWILLTM